MAISVDISKTIFPTAGVLVKPVNGKTNNSVSLYKNAANGLTGLAPINFRKIRNPSNASRIPSNN